METCKSDIEKLVVKIKELEEKFKQFEKRHQERIKLSDEKQSEMLKLFDNIVKNVLEQIESNTEKFYEMTTKMQTTYAESLEKQTTKLLSLLDNKPRVSDMMGLPLDETPKRLDDVSVNDISKEEMREDPLSEENRVPIVSGLKVQFEGEETVHSIEIS